MGLGGISIWQLLIVLLIVVVLFGTKRLRSLGGDLGSAVKGFKKAVSDDEKAKEQPAEPDSLLHSDSTSANSDEPAREKSSSEPKAH